LIDMFDHLLLGDDGSDDSHWTLNDSYRSAQIGPTMGPLHYDVAPLGAFCELTGSPDPALHDKHLTSRIEQERRKDAALAALASAIEEPNGSDLVSFAEFKDFTAGAGPLPIPAGEDLTAYVRQLEGRAARVEAPREEQVRALLAERFGDDRHRVIDPILAERFGNSPDARAEGEDR
jgi:hypothetical protein